MRNKKVKSDINQRDAPQSPKNNRRRYPRRYAKRTSTMAPRPPSNIRNPPEPAKTSKVLQKRLSPAALRSSTTSPPQATSTHSSTATAGVKINKTVITERLDHCHTTRPTAAAAAAEGQPAEALPVQKMKVNISTNGKTNTPSVSVRGKIQTIHVDCPTTSKRQNANKVLTQQRDYLPDVKTLSTSTEPAVPDRIITATPMEKNKNKEITAFLVSHQTKVHPHRFRRKKRKKHPQRTRHE